MTPLILAAGNPLRQDDGIGPALLEQLRLTPYASRLVLRDIGTDGFSLIDWVKTAERVLLIDAANMGVPPGTVKLFGPSDVKLICNGDSLSTHGMGLAEVLTLIEELDGEMPQNLTILGIQPIKTQVP